MLRTAYTYLAAFLAASLTLSAIADPSKEKSKSKLSREEGAIYLEDFLDRPLTVGVVKPANGYLTLRGDRYLGTLKSGQRVTILAMHDRAYRVRGQAQQGQIAAWVGRDFLEKLDPAFIEKLQKAAERQQQVEELIADHQIALGMTSAEVEESLGRPTKRASRLDQSGRTETYEYITYKRVPQTRYVRDLLGRVYAETYYIKVETGHVTVDFVKDIVTAVAESQEDKASGALRTVSGPIVLF